MNKENSLDQKDFDALLNWLSSDREEAGVKYEQVREGLIRFFRFKGCGDSQTLADETINRVAAKVSTFDQSKNVKTITYFYGFAANILLEYSRRAKKENVPLESIIQLQQPELEKDDPENSELGCLNSCLSELSAEEREIVIEYYSKEKRQKIEARKNLAERLQCEMNALQVRVFRLRTVLGKCIRKCVKKSL